MQVKKVGKFVLPGNSAMRVSDPCYPKGTHGSLSMESEPGLWRARIHLTKCGSWGIRVAALEVLHESQLSRCSHALPSVRLGTIGVDSGQAGFFVDSRYPDGESTGEYGDGVSFYDNCCSITCDDDSDRAAGIITDTGVVSRTGFGDGSYPLLVDTGESSLVVRSALIFINEDQFHD